MPPLSNVYNQPQKAPPPVMTNNISGMYTPPVIKTSSPIAMASVKPVKSSVQVPTTTPVQINIPKFLAAIKYNETRGVKGDPYLSSQPSGDPKLGNAIGAYRITESTFNQNKDKYLPKGTTLKQFQTTPALQDMYMTNQALSRAKQGYTPQQMADFHRAGTGVLQDKRSVNYQPGSNNYQNAAYVNAFNTTYNSK